jgi:precorrin-2 dehydrogenase/sirohydrochlorin ferrochelatase
MYPVGLYIEDKLCVVVGGGNVGQRKVMALLSEKARVCLVSPEVTPILVVLAGEGKIDWHKRKYDSGDLNGAFLVFAATDSKEVQSRVCGDAQRLGILINVIDAPAKCTFHAPAVVRQGALTLAVFTDGNSPAVAAMVRHQLEDLYGVEYALLLELMGTVRPVVIEACDTAEERKKMFADILHDDMISWIRGSRWEQVRQHLEVVIGTDIKMEFV